MSISISTSNFSFAGTGQAWRAGQAGQAPKRRERLPVYLPPDENRGTDGREGGVFAALHVFIRTGKTPGRSPPLAGSVLRPSLNEFEPACRHSICTSSTSSQGPHRAAADVYSFLHRLEIFCKILNQNVLDNIGSTLGKESSTTDTPCGYHLIAYLTLHPNFSR